MASNSQKRKRATSNAVQAHKRAPPRQAAVPRRQKQQIPATNLQTRSSVSSFDASSEEDTTDDESDTEKYHPATNIHRGPPRLNSASSSSSPDSESDGSSSSSSSESKSPGRGNEAPPPPLPRSGLARLPAPSASLRIFHHAHIATSSSESESSSDDDGPPHDGVIPHDFEYRKPTGPTPKLQPRIAPPSSDQQGHPSNKHPVRRPPVPLTAGPLPEASPEELQAGLQAAKHLSRLAAQHVRKPSASGPSHNSMGPRAQPNSDDLFVIDLEGDSRLQPAVEYSTSSITPYDRADFTDPPRVHRGTQASEPPPAFQEAPDVPLEAEQSQEHPLRPSLPFPLRNSRMVKPQDRSQRRRAFQQTSATVPPVTVPVVYTADPKQLPTGKKAKYYGVRQGREPGIYYCWADTQKQVSGCQSVHSSFKLAIDVEDFMNHKPRDCRFSACSKTCKAAANIKVNVTAEPIDEGTSEDPAQCACCSCDVLAPAMLCEPCFSDPTAWTKAVVVSEGLVPEQESVLRSVAAGKNVFFTGAAGTGKSKLIHAIRHYLRALGLSVNTIAPTGIAAVNVEGQTIHSYAGWDGNASRVDLMELCERAHLKKNWRRFQGTDVLIIDEISMVENDRLTRLSQVLQAAASTQPGDAQTRPFGGVQVIVSGDFYQLPPVLPFEHCMYCGQKMEAVKGGPTRVRKAWRVRPRR